MPRSSEVPSYNYYYFYTYDAFITTRGRQFYAIVRAMERSLVAYFILAAFILGAVFGLYVALFPMPHEMGCPFALGHTLLCVASFDHLAHWQNAFTAVLAEIIALFILAVFSWQLILLRPNNTLREVHCFREGIFILPTLFQELFSQGILNRKAP